MKLMVICASLDSLEGIADNLTPASSTAEPRHLPPIELIHYSQVLKAMDNIDEIDPEAIIISARDFPRHWKTMVQFVRQERSRKSCPVILLHGNTFTGEDAAKASFIGVNGIVRESLEPSEKAERITSILHRYLGTSARREQHYYRAEDGKRTGLCFVNPLSEVIVNAAVKTLSDTGLSFEADDPRLLADLEKNTEITECSLSLGDAIIAPRCRLLHKSPVASLAFTFMTRPDMDALKNYLTIPPPDVRS
jgi:hypothetical protein